MKPNIEIGIENASYSELANNTIIIYFPMEVESFTWVVGARTLTGREHETNYTLTITVIKQGEIYFQETILNTILYNTTHSGEFRVPYQLYVYVYGSVIENATVEVYSADGTLIQTGKTNATGWATFVLHEGEYYVRVNASGYEIFTTDVFYLNETKIISIELTPIAAPEQEEEPEAPPEVSPEKPIPTEIFLYGGLVTAVI
ncbi:MAG: carboxypeptidase regulatory-like domain-containing protein, partial [Candidatus Odinarchaeota archaeon]|nr:carboxypeptidase regulatory-like domain-containing protein [Candidatus Odinarchaeota archaeon]